MADSATRPATAARGVLVPLALAQFICSFAGSNMNVMITDMSKDLHTTVRGIQTAITIFLLVMAALMIPGGKLTERWGRKRCFNLGLAIYAVGALLSAAAPGIGVLILGNSILEGIGTALLIPPVYILTTLLFRDTASRARAFGAITGMGGVGAATGPLIGGLITTAISWRASFVFQALVIAVIIVLSRRTVVDPIPPDPTRPFDMLGAVLSAVGLVLVVMGILAAESSLLSAAALIVLGGIVLALFFVHVRDAERRGEEPLLSLALFRNRVANIGMITQSAQWLVLMGTSFVVATFLQVVRGYNAIQTGAIFTAATLGILVSSIGAERFAKRRPQKLLIAVGFLTTVVGVVLLLALVSRKSGPWAFVPGLLIIGLGVGLMLTPSVNVVQSAFPDDQQGEISGLSRCVSNLGSSLGTAIAGTILVANLNRSAYGVSMIVLGIVALGGFGATMLLPMQKPAPTPS